MQVLTTVGYATFMWNDNRLAWNTTNFGGIDRLHVSANEVHISFHDVCRIFYVYVCFVKVQQNSCELEGSKNDIFAHLAKKMIIFVASRGYRK